MIDRTRFDLPGAELPRAWYYIAADSPVPPNPVLHPATLEPVTPDFLGALFLLSLIQQEISTERYIGIPEEVREIYKLWRPAPLLRALFGKIPRHTCPHLLQVRRRVSFRQP